MDIVEGSYIPTNHKRVYLDTINGEILDKRPIGTYYGSSSTTTLVNLNRVKFNIADARVSCKDDEFLTIRLVKANITGDFSTNDYAYANPLQPYANLVTEPANYLTSQVSNATFMFSKQAWSAYGAETIPVTAPNFQSNNISVRQYNASSVLVNTVIIAFGSNGDGEMPLTTFTYSTASIAVKTYQTPYMSNCDTLQIRNIIKSAMIFGFTAGETDYDLTPIHVISNNGQLHIARDDDAGWSAGYELSFESQPTGMSGTTKAMLGVLGNWSEDDAKLIGPTGNDRMPLGINEQQVQNLYLCSDIPTTSYASNKNQNFWSTNYSTDTIGDDTHGRYSLENPTVLTNIIGSIPINPQPIYKYEYEVDIAGDTGVTAQAYKYNYLYENLTSVGSEKRIGVKDLTDITLTLYDQYLRIPHFNGSYWNVELEFTTFSRYKK